MSKVVYLLVATFIASATLYGGSALACDTCGCQDTAATAQACDCPAGECTCETTAAATTACADCPMSGECACAPKDAATAACADCPMSGECACAPTGCPFTKTQNQDAANLPDWHTKSPADLNVSLQQMEAFDVAYLPGTFADDMEALYGQLMASAGEQNLINAATHVGAFMPGVLSAEPTEATPINVALWNTGATEYSAPLMHATIPAGTYMVVEHWGDYDTIGETYMRAISWANDSGIEFNEQPSFVHHVTDPATAPVEEWLTVIYLPFTHSAS